MLSPDYSKRDYLLPKGCKDLIDVIRLEQRKEEVWLVKKLKFGVGKGALWTGEFKAMSKENMLGELPGVPPPITAEIQVAEPVTVRKLAELLGQKPFAIIADLMLLGVFATLNQVVSFEAISKVARKYGYAAKKE
jgi:hypothetical protein